jgi:hypothetical protein
VEPHPLKRRRRIQAAAALLLVVAGLGWWWWSVGRSSSGGPAGHIHADVRAPDGTRIKVEVLNATRTRGLARRAMFHLRDRGFDVVGIGTAPAQADSTLVLDRSGHPEWASLVARALGGARVESRPDSSRYLDVTVLLGASWRPPSEPFYP